MLELYLEAGGTLAEFWSIETPRTTLIRIQAYRRRRGWQAWNTAVWGRFTFDGYEMGIPPLHEAMGLPPPQARVQSPDEMSRVMRAWVAATKGQRPN